MKSRIIFAGLPMMPSFSKTLSSELIAEIYYINRVAIYEWLARYRQDGGQSLDTRKAPDSSPTMPITSIGS